MATLVANVFDRRAMTLNLTGDAFDKLVETDNIASSYFGSVEICYDRCFIWL